MVSHDGEVPLLADGVQVVTEDRGATPVAMECGEVEWGRTPRQRRVHLLRAVCAIRDCMHGTSLPYQDKDVVLYEIYSSPFVRMAGKVAVVLSLIVEVLKSAPESHYNSMEVAYNIVIIIVNTLVTIVFFLFGAAEYRILGFHRFIRTPMCFLRALLSFALTVGVVIEMFHTDRFSPSLFFIIRPVIAVVHFPKLRRTFVNIMKTGWALVPVLLFTTIFVGIYSIYGYVLFSSTNNYYTTLPVSLWETFVALTTANFPDIMIESYTQNGNVTRVQDVSKLGRKTTVVTVTTYITHSHAKPIESWGELGRTLSPFYFISFYLLGLYVLMSVAFAVVYEEYKRHLRSTVISTHLFRTTMLQEAFTQLCRYRGKDYVDFLAFHALYVELFPKRASDTRYVRAQFHAMDLTESGRLDAAAFKVFYILLQFKVSEIHDSRPLVESWFPSWSLNSSIASALRRYVTGSGVEKVMCFLIVSDVVALIFHMYRTPPNQNPEGVKESYISLVLIDLALGLLLDTQVLLKLTFMGFSCYWWKKWNRFDLFCTCYNSIIYIILAVLSCLYGFSEALFILMMFSKHSSPTDNHSSRFAPNVPILFLLFLRLVRCSRLISLYKPFRIVLKTFSNLLPAFFSYLSAMILVQYVFAIMGMLIFRRAVPGPTTQFALSNYYALNFNTFFNACVTLFSLMVVNNWYIIVDGYRDAVGDHVFPYFLVYYCVSVLMLVDILTAFIVELWSSQWQVNNEGTLRLESHPLAARILMLNHITEEHPKYAELGCNHAADGSVPQWRVSFARYSAKVEYALERIFLDERDLFHAAPQQAN